MSFKSITSVDNIYINKHRRIKSKEAILKLLRFSIFPANCYECR